MENERNEKPDDGDGPEKQPRFRFNLGTILLLILGVGIFVPMIVSFLGASGTENTMSYSAFKNELRSNNVATITVQEEKITGTFKRPPNTGLSSGSASISFITYLPSYGDNELSTLLEEQAVRVYTKPINRGSALSIILNLLPFLLLLFVLYSFYRGSRQQGNNLFSVGQNKAKLYQKSSEKTTFADVAGLDGAKEELAEIVSFLTAPESFQKMGARTPKGVLLVGPPGTGKTLLARAVAGEADAPYYSITGSDFMELFVGVGASRVRSLFRDARKHTSSIIFIDELDSIGRHRGAGLGGGHDEREQTLNQLLSELDGFEPNESTIVIAATNRPDILDPALLRPGRFDRQITVDRPTVVDRTGILGIHARNKPFGASVDLESVARATPGFTGADLENLLNESALLAARRQSGTIEQGDIDKAQDKILLGLVRKNLVLTEEERKTVAYHEAGHAVVAAFLPNAEPVHKVTIIPRDRSMGVTQQLPEGDKYLFNREYILDRIAVTLGGRAAEELQLGTITSGAENDLKQATRLAKKMVLDWGMSDKLGTIALGSDNDFVFLGEDIAQRREFSEETAKDIDSEIRAILRTAFERARTLLAAKDGYLISVADALLEREELLGRDIRELLDLGQTDEIDQRDGESERRSDSA